MARPYIKAGHVSRRCLEKLLGRLGSPKTSVFGKFARAQLRPLYQKFYRRVYNARLSQLERGNLSWWLAAIADFAPRLAFGHQSGQAVCAPLPMELPAPFNGHPRHCPG